MSTSILCGVWTGRKTRSSVCRGGALRLGDGIVGIHWSQVYWLQDWRLAAQVCCSSTYGCQWPRWLFEVDFGSSWKSSQPATCSGKAGSWFQERRMQGICQVLWLSELEEGKNVRLWCSSLCRLTASLWNLLYIANKGFITASKGFFIQILSGSQKRLWL